MNLDLKKVNKLTSKELYFNIEYIKKIFDQDSIDKKTLYFDIITGHAAQSENLTDVGNKMLSSIISNPLSKLLNNIKVYREIKIAKKIEQVENFLENLSKGEVSLGDYLGYLNDKYKLTAINNFSNVSKVYELEVKLVNSEITLAEFSQLNRLKGISGVENKILLNDFMHKKDSDAIIKSSTLYTYKDLLEQKINNGKVLNEFDFKNILKIEGLSDKQVEQLVKMSKAQQLDMKHNHIKLMEQDKFKSKFQKNALDVIREEHQKDVNKNKL